MVLLLAAAPAAAGERIEQLLQAMTLREKLGQLDLRSADLARTGPELRSDYRSAVRQGIVGGLFNAYGAEFTRRLQEIAVHETRLGIPLLFAFDVVHGHRTVFPIPLAEAASFDVALAERTARIAAIEATAEGVSWTFAPMLDVSRDPRWGRIAEGPGEDPWWGAQLAAAKVRGFQGSDLTAPDTLAATAKHLGGYGAPEGGRDYNTAEVSERTLREVYLPPFRAAVNAGVSAIMPAFNDIAGVPGTANRALLDGVVRGDWGFGGVIVSDYHAVPELVVHGVAADPAEAATLALSAGVDVDMESDAFARGLPRALRSGRAKLAAVDAAVRRVLTLKERLGLFDDPFRYSNPTREAEVRRAAHRAEARDAARRSIVLLKNAGGLLPIARDVGTIAVVGPLADAAEEMLGPWAAAGDPEAAVSLLDGIRAAASPTTRVLHAPGTAIAGGTRAGFDAALEAAREADVVVLCLGESAAMSGEGASRASLTLPGRQQELADAVIATGKPVVVTLTGGRP
ncbi:MAG TPA: glycoside hydrolase family 3 N-terminal domain-containing protein, partial [Geminicoccaceae bacterium]|nr:glycoside hydrolase family 3 N-terminal domain-containing protein [Geminicoccaceae bacterium]